MGKPSSSGGTCRNIVHDARRRRGQRFNPDIRILRRLNVVAG